jgi:hypothetical protein
LRRLQIKIQNSEVEKMFTIKMQNDEGVTYTLHNLTNDEVKSIQVTAKLMQWDVTIEEQEGEY